MLAPAIPEDEARRVRALRRLGLLDTEPEERFDRVTRLAHRMFGVAAAAITLIDADRAWQKSASGETRGETPREFSLCAHAILDPGGLTVEDALDDPRFRDNPSVTGEPHVRFYAGHPITTPDGSPVGAFCIFDTQPRHLEPDEELALRDLALMVERELAATQLAVDDDLTGLANRKGFQLLAEKALALCTRRRVDAVLVCVDIDGLRAVNDLDGHEAGNRLVKRTAAVLTAAYRRADVVARLGGDEFAALLTDFGADDRIAVQRLNDALEAANGEHPGRRLSLAVGTARWRHDDPVELAMLLERADAAMCEDRRGRDLTA